MATNFIDNTQTPNFNENKQVTNFNESKTVVKNSVSKKCSTKANNVKDIVQSRGIDHPEFTACITSQENVFRADSEISQGNISKSKEFVTSSSGQAPVPQSSGNFNVGCSTANFSGSGTLSSSGVIAPHYFSQILNAPQSFIRPLVATQLPIYSSGLPAQQHTFQAAHPSSAGQYALLSDPPTRSNESVMCQPEMFKEMSLGVRHHSKNIASDGSSITEKSLNHQNHRQFSSEKRTNGVENYNSVRFSSCSETSKQNNNVTIHDQHLFDEYVRMYGEEGNFRNWTDSSLPHPPSTFQNPQNSSVALTGSNNVLVYDENQTHTDVPVQEFSDCRLESSWRRGHVNQITSNNNNFIIGNHTLASSKNDVKGCNESQIRLNNKVENISNSVSMPGKSQFDYQQGVPTGHFTTVLPYLPPSNYQQPLDQLLCHGSQITNNMERRVTVHEKHSAESESQIKESIEKEKKQIKSSPNTLLPPPVCNVTTLQGCSVINLNSPQSASVLTVDTTQDTSVHAVNTSQVSSVNNAVVSTQVSLVHSANVSQASSNHIVNTIQVSSIHNITPQTPISVSNDGDNAPHASSVQPAVAPQILSTQNVNNCNEDSLSLDTSKQNCPSSDSSPSSIPPSNSKLLPASQGIPMHINTIASTRAITSIETTTPSRSKMIMADVSSEENVQMQKCQKDDTSKNLEHMKKVSRERSTNHVVTANDCCCLLCGSAMEASSHCLIDTLITVPSKISICEKLSQIVGFPLPRDILPSLYICPKCFHLVNEVDVLEHRLNMCRREVLFAIEQIFERNGIHVSPYKRFQRQQCIVPFQSHEMQFSHYQQPASSSCLQTTFQNDSQNFQVHNHVYASQTPNVVTDHLPLSSCDISSNLFDPHTGMQSHMHGSHLENGFHLQSHSHHSHHIQPNYHQHIQNQSDLSNHPLAAHHLNSSQAEHHKGSQIQIGMKKIHNISDECKQTHQLINDHFECNEVNHPSLPLDNSHHSLINSQHQLHQSQHHETFIDKSHTIVNSSCQVDLPMIHDSNPTIIPKAPKEQYQPPNSLQNLSHETLEAAKCHSKSILTSQSQVQQTTVQHNQKSPAELEASTTVTMETNIQDKTQERCQRVELTQCLMKSDVVNTNSNMIASSSSRDTYFPQENQINMARPMSVLLSTYIQPDPQEFSAELITLNRLNFDKESQSSKEKKNSIENNEIQRVEKELSQELQDTSSVDHNWTNSNSTDDLSLESISENGMNHSDCDVDIEKCDIKVEVYPVSTNSITSPTCDTVTAEVGKFRGRLANITTTNQMPTKRKVNFVAQVSEIIGLNSGVDSVNSVSPISSNLDMFFSPSSPPPPPEGPPEGLRNVQDATEYHKPTLLGKNIKVKKHAKLQICRQCDQVFSNRQALVRHIERRHKSYHVSYHSCDTCHRKFNSERTLKHHLQSHKTYPCKICDKIFLRKVKLKKHFEEHTKTNLVCEVCKKETGSMQALISHLKTHERTPKSFICSICSKVFTCKRNLDHHSLIHSGEKPFSCRNCKKSFRHRSNMVAHHKLCSGTFIFVCSRPKCGKIFALKSLFERHTAEHDGHFAHLCSICNKGFGKSSDLLNHFATHGEDSTDIDKKCSSCGPNGCNAENVSFKCNKKTICPICSKVILRRDALKDHLAFHEGIRNYQCEKCSSSFIYRSNLFFHVKTVHWLHRPFACSLCHKTFTNSSSHNLHLRTHSGERPFQCDSCGKTFTSRSNYNRHLKCHVIHQHRSVESCSDSTVP